MKNTFDTGCISVSFNVITLALYPFIFLCNLRCKTKLKEVRQMKEMDKTGHFVS